MLSKCEKTAALYIASLRAMSIIHSHSHWSTKGNDFYGNHLLFERLYDSTLKDLDMAAEKFMGLLGGECLDYQLQAELLHKVLLKYKEAEGHPLVMSLAVEKDFIKFSKDAYNCFGDEGALTLGLDDMLMSIASKREESVYLLQQTLGKMEKDAAQQSKGTLKKLAAYQELMQYLMRAIPLAAANVGVNSVIVTQVAPPQKDTGIIDARASNIPEDKMSAVKASLEKLFAAQKPELVGKVNLLPANY